MPFGLVRRLPAHRPREVLGIPPLGGAGCDEELGHLHLVHVLVDRAVGRRPERVEQECDLILLDEPADHLDRLRRAVAVVVGDEVDLPAVDTALVVQLLEVRGDHLADRAVRRRVAAVGIRVTDLDLGRSHARRIGGDRQPGEQRQADPQRKSQSDDASARHAVLLLSG